jgi:lysine 2,3-aminomutase
MEIMEGLRGHISGLGIPTYVVDSPHGGGKIPVMPNYVIPASDDAVVLRNDEGMLVRYQAEDKPNTCQPAASRGVSALLQGTKSALIPENSERMARRQRIALVEIPVEEAIPPGAEGHGQGCGGGAGHGSDPTGSRAGLFPLNIVANGYGS